VFVFRSPLNVYVALDFNVQTGLLTAAFTSLDPAGTGEAPTGVFDGFLPPDSSSGIGEGFVQHVTAEDSSGNVVTGYAGTVQFTSSDPREPAPAVRCFSPRFIKASRQLSHRRSMLSRRSGSWTPSE
jgi:hypothetical protein